MVSKNNKKNNKQVLMKKPNQNKKNNDKKPQIPHKPEIVTPKVVEEESSDGLSEEELKKMLGDNSDNSDYEVSEDDSSDEVVEEESKLAHKRKLEVDSDENNVCPAKKVKETEVSDEDDVEISDDEDEDDSDEIDSNDSFIAKDSVDEDAEEDSDAEDEKMETEEVEEKPVKADKPVIKVKPVKKDKSDDEKVKIAAVAEAKKIEDKEVLSRIFVDVGLVEGESLRQEANRRLTDRLTKTIVLINVPKKFGNNEALQMFPKRVSCIIPYDIYKHQSSGNAYVDFETVAAAQKALDSLDENTKIKGFFQKKAQTDIDAYNCRRLALNNLPFNTSIDDVKKVFTKAKSVDFLPIKKVDRRLTRVAFLEYSSVEEAVSELDAHHGGLIKGNPVHVKFQQKSATSTKERKPISNCTKLVVMGVRKNHKDEDIKAMFPQSTSIYVDNTKGMAKVEFSTADECNIDKQAATKNKFCKSMKIFFDTSSTAKTNVNVEKKTDNKSKNKKFDNKKKAQNLPVKKPEFKPKEKKVKKNALKNYSDKTKLGVNKEDIKKINKSPYKLEDILKDISKAEQKKKQDHQPKIEIKAAKKIIPEASQKSITQPGLSQKENTKSLTISKPIVEKSQSPKNKSTATNLTEKTTSTPDNTEKKKKKKKKNKKNKDATIQNHTTESKPLGIVNLSSNTSTDGEKHKKNMSDDHAETPNAERVKIATLSQTQNNSNLPSKINLQKHSKFNKKMAMVNPKKQNKFQKKIKKNQKKKH